MAREVTLQEIKQIKAQAPETELEYFVHGAMCMSYSGRCILSKWMTNRSANLGDCAQPCRWLYHRHDSNKQQLNVLDDQDRFEIHLEEDRHGTYFFNSYDLCLIEHLGDLVKAGVDSLKIEGRAKSVYYVALVVRAYRKVLDAYADQGIAKEKLNKVIQDQKNELAKLSNRGYTKGFLLGIEPDHLFEMAAKESEWTFVGISDDKDNSKTRNVFVHNKIRVSDDVQVVTPDANKKVKVISILDKDEGMVGAAHGGQSKKFKIKFSEKIEDIFLLRKRN